MPKLVWRVKLVAELEPGVTTETEVACHRRGYYRPGVGAAVGLGVLGAAALGAAAAAPYYGYGGNPCLRQQQVVDAWGNAQWAYVRVC